MLEKPPVPAVENAWITASNKFIPPKSKKINEIRIDLSATRKEQQNLVTKDEFNALLDYSKKVIDFDYKVLDTIKNEGTKIALKNELAELESQAPKELVVVVEEKPKEKVITRF